MAMTAQFPPYERNHWHLVSQWQFHFRGSFSCLIRLPLSDFCYIADEESNAVTKSRDHFQIRWPHRTPAFQSHMASGTIGEISAAFCFLFFLFFLFSSFFWFTYSMSFPSSPSFSTYYYALPVIFEWLPNKQKKNMYIQGSF